MLRDMPFLEKVKICILICKGLRKGGDKILLSNWMRWPLREPT